MIRGIRHGLTRTPGVVPSATPNESDGRNHRLDRLLARARSRLTRLHPQEACDAIQNGALLVDIRPEFQRRMDGEIPDTVIVERNHLEWRLHPASSGRIEEAVDVNVH